jgi:hypothetical protein
MPTCHLTRYTMSISLQRRVFKSDSTPPPPSSSSPHPIPSKQLRADMDCIARELERQDYCVESMRMEGRNVLVQGHDDVTGSKREWRFERI